MKSVWGVLAVLLGLSVVLSGCGVGTSLVQREPITLHYAYAGDAAQIEPVLQEFEDSHPGIQVELVSADTSDGGETLYRSIAGGDVDLLRGGTELLALAERNMLLPLDDVQLAQWADSRDDYFGGVWSNLSLAGKQYGIPAGLDIAVLFVNMDAALAAGVDLPAVGSTWDTYAFLDLATRLNYPEGLPSDPTRQIYGFCSNHQELDPFIFTYLNGGAIVDDLTNPTRPTLDDPATVDAIKWYVDLFTLYGVAPRPGFMGLNYGSTGLAVALASGRCGMWVGQLSQRGYLNDYPVKFAWEMLPLPAGQSGMGMGMVEGYYIPKSAKHRDEALTLAAYLSDDWRGSGRFLPPRRSQVADSGYIASVGEQIASQAASYADGLIVVPADFTPQLAQVGVAALDAIDEAITDDGDIETLLQQAQQVAERAFDQ